MEYGYIRVSSKEQNEARQLDALHKQGIEDKNIYMDKQSGKDFNRPKYKILYRKLKNWRARHITIEDAARECGMCTKTFYSKAVKAEMEENDAE